MVEHGRIITMWDIIGLLKSGLDTAGKIMSRVWGDQTSAEASLQQRAEEAATKKHAALALLREANASGDQHAISQALSALNGWDAELKRLKDQAEAQRS